MSYCVSKKLFHGNSDSMINVAPITDEPSGSVFSGYTILTKGMMGVGILSLAYALEASGWYFGIGISILSPLLLAFSSHLVSLLGSEYKESLQGNDKRHLSYYGMASRLSVRAAWLLDLGLIIFSFGKMVAYSIVSASMITEILISLGVTLGLSSTSLTIVIKVIVGALLSPLCLAKEIKNTTIPNALAIACLLYIVCFAIIKADPYGASFVGTHEHMYHPKSWVSIVVSFPKFVFAYCAVQNLFGVANETSKFSVRRLDGMMFAGIFTAFSLNTICSILPFVTFGSGIKSNFLKNFSSDLSPATLAVRIAAAFQVSVGFVLVLHPMRSSLIGLVKRNGLAPKSDVAMRWSIATLVIIASIGTAIGLGNDMGIVIELAGFLGANTICFVVPTYLFCISRERKESPVLWVMAAALLCFGVVLYPLGIYGVAYTYSQS